MAGHGPAAARGDLLPSAIMALLGTRGPVSRADIARALDVSPATVTQLTKQLIGRGLVAELETAPSQGGRPARLLGLVRSAGGAIGAKVTADHVAVVHVALDGTVRHTSSHAFDPDAPHVLDVLGHILSAAVEQHEGTLLGVGVGVPGSVDALPSGVVEAPTLGWSDVHLGAFLRHTLGVPVLVENDVNTLAVAERLYGLGQAHRSYLVVTIGRGIGCGIVVDGAVYRGASGGAGEIGHTPIRLDGRACACGAHGCLEAYIGQAALLRTGVERGVLAEGAGMAELSAAAARGDRAALGIFEEAGSLLGQALAGVVHTVDPEIVVLLGEGIVAWPYWQSGFETSFRGHLMPARRGLPFAVEPWSDDKWALGAAALVLATPFDSTGLSGEQGRLVRERMHLSPATEVTP